PVPEPVSSSGAPARKPAPPAPAKEVAALLPGTGGGGPTVHAGNPHASTWQGTPEGVAAEHGWDQYRDTINIWAPRFRATLRALAHRAL
ncbi:MAG: hypothetical protein ACRDLV_08245, partial [Solirubrobacteraceae bacterium]